MTTYLLILDGPGEGCDYTIGCNVAVREIEANSSDEAYLKIHEIWKDAEASEGAEHYTDPTKEERYWANARLAVKTRFHGEGLGSNGMSLMDVVLNWRSELARKAEALNNDSAEARDRAELKRLRKLYPNA